MDIVAESIPRKLVTVLKLSSNKIHRVVYIECTGQWLDKICYLDQEHDGLALCPADDLLVTSNAHFTCKPDSGQPASSGRLIESGFRF